MRNDYELYWRIAGVVIRAGWAASKVAFYVTCLLAAQLIVACLAAFSRGATGVRTNARADAIVTAALCGGLIVFVFAAGIGIATREPAGWLTGLAVGGLVGAVVAWNVGSWQEAFSWSRSPGALFLGQWRDGRFFVQRPYTVTHGERMKHMHVSGATGSGKSTLLQNLIVQDLRSGAGLCVIDPKDQLIDGLLAHVPEERIDDVILFDASDPDPLGLNPFADVKEEERSLATSELIAVFRRYFADSWGSRLEHVFRNVILALLEVPGATLIDVPRLLLEEPYRRWALTHVTNPAVRNFWMIEFEQVLRRRNDVIAPVLSKLGPWLEYPELSRIMGQPSNTFNMRQVMDEGRILLVRIPQGALGEDISNLLGALVVARVQLAVQSRVNLPPERRRPFYLYVDEFQNFATSSFTKILTEARSFGLGLVCANQFPEQLSRDLRLALDKNAATFVQTVYRKGRYVAETRSREEDQDGQVPIRLVSPPPPLAGGDTARAVRFRERSRELYGRGPEDPARVPDDGRQIENTAGATITTGSEGRDVEEE